MPDPTAQGNPPATQPPASENGRPSDSSPGEKNQQQAAEQLKKAGQQVAEAGKDMPAMESQPAGGEWDPLIPESERSSQSESDVFSDDVAEASSSSAGDAQQAEADSDSAPAAAEESPTSDQAADNTGIPAAPETGADLAEQIRAAQEAMENAGIAMQRAGDILESAQTAEELAAAEAALARARVAVIVAGQDLLDLEELMQDSGNEDLLQDTQNTLNDANVAIVIATDSIFSSRIDLPEFESQQVQRSRGSGRESQLEKELSDSIIVFENEILEARADVIGSAPPPTSSENVPGVAVLGGRVNAETGTFEDNPDDPVIINDPETAIQQGRMPEGAELAAVENGSGSLIPDDVPDPQGDDIVAQQLREAAIAEADPDLRAKLWEEYKRYRAGL